MNTLNQNNPKENELIKHIDYAYTTTTYSSQGKTSKNVIYTLESYRPILTNQKDFYVGLSRTKDNMFNYIESRLLKEQMNYVFLDEIQNVGKFQWV